MPCGGGSNRPEALHVKSIQFASMRFIHNVRGDSADESPLICISGNAERAQIIGLAVLPSGS